MFWSFRRSSLVVISLGLVTVLCVLYSYRVSPYAIIPIQSDDSKPTPKSPYVGHSAWSVRKPHYPVKDVTPVPRAKPIEVPPVQHFFGLETDDEKATRIERQKAVKAVFVRCWQSYRDRAWLKDELVPISGQSRNAFGGWAATLVDSLDTLWLMDLKYEFFEAVGALPKIDFSTSTEEIVNVFETTIRYLGGLLGAYDISVVPELLPKIVEVGEMLLVAFDTPNHMPITRWPWRKAKEGRRQQAPDWTLVSEIGSLSLEFTRLSQITLDNRWYDAIRRITDLFDKQQHQTKFPGMWPVVVNPRDEDTTFDTRFTLGGMSDSLYEYFPKQFALLGGLDITYRKLYEGAIDAAAQHMFFRPMTPQEHDILISGTIHATGPGGTPVLEPEGQHLTCFAGGMLALGSRLFENEEHLKLARKLTDGCIWAYNSTSAGVMPEIARFVPCQSKQSCPWDEDQWKAAVLERAGPLAAVNGVDKYIASRKLPPGYVEITDPRYILRPEAIESVFIMYRVTGDNYYREVAWEMFNTIDKISRTSYANAAVRDITTTDSDGLPPKDDRMESFWLAETLKYFYLIFSEPGFVSLDRFVLNTEAHPLRRPLEALRPMR